MKSYNHFYELSYMGWITHTNTYGMYLKYIKPFINVKRLKRVVRKHDKEMNKQCGKCQKTAAA